MSRRRDLVLIVPDLASAFIQRPATPGPPTLLATMAGRGAVRYAWDRRDLQALWRPWQRGLLDALGLDAAAFPSAATSAHAIVGADAGYWLHADPVHLLAGMDSLSLVPVPNVTDAERQSLGATVGEHAHNASFSFHTGSDRRWFLRSARALQLETAPPEAAAANELSQAMPRGADSRAIRRLMTELQMVLHEHPVNEQRVRRGLPALNAVWLWGGGTQRTHTAQSLPMALGEEIFLRGVYAALSQTLAPAPRQAADLLEVMRAQMRAVAVVRADTPQGLETDWVAPLLQGLKQRRFDRLEIVLDSWHLQLDRMALRRFWRRPLSPSQWAA